MQGIKAYAKGATAHLQRVLDSNLKKMDQLAEKISKDAQQGKSLFAFGSGHSALLPLELFHRAGGASFLIPLVAEPFLPSAGPSLVRLMERTPKSANFLLDRAQPKKGEMLWLFSQSGINPAIIDMAEYAHAKGLYTVAFTSLSHSKAVPSRHPSGRKLFQVCDEVMDLGGIRGDAIVPISKSMSVGPVSTLGGIFLAHCILSETLLKLERRGKKFAYTSVNTPEGEQRNKTLERKGSKRDPLLR